MRQDYRVLDQDQAIEEKDRDQDHIFCSQEQDHRLETNALKTANKKKHKSKGVNPN